VVADFIGDADRVARRQIPPDRLQDFHRTAQIVRRRLRLAQRLARAPAEIEGFPQVSAALPLLGAGDALVEHLNRRCGMAGFQLRSPQPRDQPVGVDAVPERLPNGQASLEPFFRLAVIPQAQPREAQQLVRRRFHAAISACLGCPQSRPQ
jgi:hypothetical protein